MPPTACCPPPATVSGSKRKMVRSPIMYRGCLLQRLAVSFAGWTRSAVRYTLQPIVRLRARWGTPVSSPRLLGQQVAFFVPWALATPLVIGLGERFPIRRTRWLAPLAIHLGAVVLLTALHCISIVAAEAPQDMAAAKAAWAACMTRGMLLLDAFLYLTVSLAGVALRLRQKHRERERDVSRLEIQLAQARVRALEAQLHPHFAFNALNTVAMLIRDRRNDLALRTLVAFSDLLRGLLAREAPMVTLESELESVNRYLDIESMRFSDRLQVEVHADPEILGANVPSLLLQPLVENAIRHGASAREGQFHLSIHARRVMDRLALTVEDDGPGLPHGWSIEQSTGLGLRNTRERLRQIYGDEARFHLAPGAERGLRVLIEVPVRANVAAEVR